MDFKTAITNGFKQYVDFGGRTGEEEYKSWTIFYFLCHIICSFIATLAYLLIVIPYVGPVLLLLLCVILSVILLALFLPNLAMTFRRLRDNGKSEWLGLLILIPSGIGNIIQIVFCFALNNVTNTVIETKTTAEEVKTETTVEKDETETKE